MPRPNQEQWADLVQDLDDVVADLRRDGHELLRRAEQPREQGYPTSSRPSASGKGGVSDPVGDLVARELDNPLRDPVKQAATVMVRHALRAKSELRAAQKALDYGLPTNDTPKQSAEVVPIGSRAPQEVPDCANPNHDGLALPRPKAGRCEPCYKWRLRHAGEERPRNVCHSDEEAQAA